MSRLVLFALIALSALGSLHGAAPAATLSTGWAPTDLGKSCFPQAQNDRGQVAGYCWSAATKTEHAFLWTGGKLQDLGTLAPDRSSIPTAINDRGEVVGESVRYGPIGNTDGVVESQPFLWEDGRMTTLATLGGKLSGVQALNDRGWAIGYSETSDGERHGVLWRDRQLVDLGAGFYATALNNGGQMIGSDAAGGVLWTAGRTRPLDFAPAAINDRGQIVGRRGFRGRVGHAVVWQGGRVSDLGTLPGNHTGADAISDDGRIAGTSYGIRVRRGTVVVWETGRRFVLPKLGAAEVRLGSAPGHAVTRAINTRGQVIVGAAGPSRKHAYVWQNGRVVALRTLGGGEAEAYAINNRGQVIGASTTAAGETHGVVWTAH